MTRWADPSAVEDASAEWSDKLVHCRIYGHGWTPSSVTRAGDGFIVRQQCGRCTNEREQVMSSTGMAEPWRYIYSEGYLTEGLGRIGGDGRAVLRLAALRNLTILEPEE
jgi:hypothetical protein